MPLRLKVSLDAAEIVKLGGPGGLVDQAVRKAAGRTRDRAKQNLTTAGRVDTGALRQSVVSERYGSGGTLITYLVGSPLPYAIYNEQGTGIYGPRHAMIVPRRAKVLRWKSRKTGAFVFAPSVKGMEGTRFLERALYDLTAADFTG